MIMIFVADWVLNINYQYLPTYCQNRVCICICPWGQHRHLHLTTLLPEVQRKVCFSFFFRQHANLAGTLSGHGSWVLSVDFCPDNTHFVSAWVVLYFHPDCSIYWVLTSVLTTNTLCVSSPSLSPWLFDILSVDDFCPDNKHLVSVWIVLHFHHDGAVYFLPLNHLWFCSFQS